MGKGRFPEGERPSSLVLSPVSASLSDVDSGAQKPLYTRTAPRPSPAEGFSGQASTPPRVSLAPRCRRHAGRTRWTSRTSMSNSYDRDEDDLFAHTRMSLGDHIEELRQALWRAIYWFLGGLVLGFVVAGWVLQFIAAPAEKELQRFHKERLAEARKKQEEAYKKLMDARAQGADVEVPAIFQPQPLQLELDRAQLAGAIGVRPPNGEDWQGQKVQLTAYVTPFQAYELQDQAKS